MKNVWGCTVANVDINNKSNTQNMASECFSGREAAENYGMFYVQQAVTNGGEGGAKRVPEWNISGGAVLASEASHKIWHTMNKCVHKLALFSCHRTLRLRTIYVVRLHCTLYYTKVEHFGSYYSYPDGHIVMEYNQNTMWKTYNRNILNTLHRNVD